MREGRQALFRCRFGRSEGWGHVVRCSALATELQRRGWRTRLWTEGELSVLPPSVRSAFDEQVEGPEGESSVLVVDEMYASEAELRRGVDAWRSAGNEGVAVGIDDLQRRRMDGFDVVVNTELGLETAGYAAPRLLLGERYALLRPGFAAPEEVAPSLLPGAGRPVLVMLGGTDAYGWTGQALESLAAWRSEELVPVVVSGGQGTYAREILRTLNTFPDYRWLGRVDASELAGWMACCSFGVIACGSSLFEAAAMELPFVGLCLVDNQVASARQAQTRWGMPIVYRDGGSREPLDLRPSLTALESRRRRKYSNVDTRGAERVCSAVLDELERRLG